MFFYKKHKTCFYHLCLKCDALGSMKIQDAKNRHFSTIAQVCRAISSQLRHVSAIGKILNSNTSSTCPYNMVNFGQLTSEIFWRVWGIPSKFQRLSRLGGVTARHCVVGVTQTLRR